METLINTNTPQNIISMSHNKFFFVSLTSLCTAIKIKYFISVLGFISVSLIIQKSGEKMLFIKNKYYFLPAFRYGF